MPLPSNCISVSASARSAAKVHAGARLHLPLERIAVQVDDARQHQQFFRVERPGIGRRRTVEPDHPAVGEQQVGRSEPVFGQHPPAENLDGPGHGSKTSCTRGVGNRLTPNSTMPPPRSTLTFSATSTGRERGVRSSSASRGCGSRAVTRLDWRR